MATMQEAIRRLRIEATDRGISETTEKLRKLAQAQDAVTVADERSARAQQSTERRLESIQRRYDVAYRQQQDLTRIERDLTLARQQGLITQARQNELMALAAGQQSRMATVMSEAKIQAESLAGRSGSLGMALASVGKAGLIAAAAFGAYQIVMEGLVGEASRLAQKAGALVDFAETTGLATTALQALQKAGAEVGVGAEQIGTSFERFSVQLAELRDGSGDLLKQLAKIDPALVTQMATARDAAQAWDVLAKAYVRADEAQRNVLARAAFGRQGIPIGRLLNASNEAGGIDGLIKGLGAANTLTNEQLKRWDELKDKIDITASIARDQFASIFTEKVLESELRFFETMLLIAQAAKQVPWEKIGDMLSRGFSAAFPTLSAIATTVGALASSPSLRKSDALQSSANSRVASSFSALGAPPAAAPAGAPLSAEFELNQLKRVAEAMGSAATAAQQLEIKQKQLAIAAKEVGLSQDQYNRALAALNLDNVIQLEAKRLGLLGELAPALEVEKQKQNEINLARMQGVRITEAESKAIVERARLAQEYSQLPNQLAFERSQLGRNDIDAAVAQRLRSANLPIDFNSATAQVIRYNEELRRTKDIMTDLGVGFGRDFLQAIRDGATAWEAFRKAGANALNKLADILMEIAMRNLMAQAFGGLFGGGASIPGLPVATAHTGGIVGQIPASTYIHPAYFENAPRYHSGGIVGRERPIIAMDDEEVITRWDPRHRWNGGMRRRGDGSPFNFTDNRVYNVQGSGPEIDRLREELARERAEAPARILRTIRDAQSRRLIR